jgi:alpha-glucosidase (family GH31 glycosyl hydrolase)
MDLTKTSGVYWVPLLDIGIATGTYAATEGEKLDVFLKSSVYKGKYLEGCVWPGPVYFPDFNHPNALKYWMDMTIYMRDVL